MKKIQISPSILSADFSQLGNEVKKLEEKLEGKFKGNIKSVVRLISDPAIDDSEKDTLLNQILRLEDKSEN